LKRLQTKEWKDLRRTCLERDKRVCRKCGKPANQVHHIIPFNKGGKDELTNTISLCKKHHAIADNTYFKYGLTSMAKIWLKENLSLV